MSESKLNLGGGEMKSFREVGLAVGLKGNHLNLYVDYMTKRWAGEETILCQTGYASEWAERFLNNLEWECSDSQGQLVLKELMGK